MTDPSPRARHRSCNSGLWRGRGARGPGRHGRHDSGCHNRRAPAAGPNFRPRSSAPPAPPAPPATGGPQRVRLGNGRAVRHYRACRCVSSAYVRDRLSLVFSSVEVQRLVHGPIIAVSRPVTASSRQTRHMLAVAIATGDGRLRRADGHRATVQNLIELASCALLVADLYV